MRVALDEHREEFVPGGDFGPVNGRVTERTRIRLLGGNVQLTARMVRYTCSNTGMSQVSSGDCVVLRHTGRRSALSTGRPAVKRSIVG
jgi:hypothetical protein